MDQSDIHDPRVADLTRPENLPDEPDGTVVRGDVEHCFTHGSIVFLTRQAVYKLKRAKDFGFFDYSTLAKRKHFCEEEVRLNRRGAPDVYLGVLPVYRDERGHSFNRRGEIVDYAVHMVRLPDARNARSLLRQGDLSGDDVGRIAERAVAFYRDADPHPPAADGLRESFEENFEQVAPMVGDLVGRERFDEIERRQRQWLDAHWEALSARSCRDGHGDLRLEHVYLMERVLLIDCIEFLDRFRIADPALDAAFLGMDLHREGRPDLAELFLARFAAGSHDYDLYPLVDGYMSYRAVVRAKVAGFVATDADAAEAVVARKRDEAAQLFELAERLMARDGSRARVIAVGGCIATGKSTVAARIADSLNVPVVNADTTRKHLARDENAGEAERDIYTDAFSARVYDEVMQRAGAVLASGRTVVVDTTFQARTTRDRVRALAADRGAGFLMVECRAPEAELRRRLRSREDGGGDPSGASDAREDLLDEFMARFEPFDELADDERLVLDTTLPESEQRGLLRRAGVLAEP